MTGRADDVDEASPLNCPVRQGDVELCQMTVGDGSNDIACAMGVSPRVGKPVLHPALVSLRMADERRGELLKELCSGSTYCRHTLTS